jgi:hypothetical protein
MVLRRAMDEPRVCLAERSPHDEEVVHGGVIAQPAARVKR